MPNPDWQLSSKEQLLQDQLQHERQEFQDWKLEMSKNLAQGIQSQAQAPSLVDLTEPPIDIYAPVEVINKPQRSASVKRSRSQDQTHSVSKRARSTTATSKRSLSPKRDYPRGTSTVTRPTPSSPTLSSPIKIQDRPVQAQDLANFKTDMTSLIQDMIQSSLSSLPPSLKIALGVRETLFKIKLKRSLEIKIEIWSWIMWIPQKGRKESWPLRKRT